ncbi:hypothetical protein BsWGS_06962 [Bradybaena similaris]
MFHDVGVKRTTWLLAQFILHATGQVWHEYEGHCYAILNVKDNFNSCKASCQQHGSYVVELDDEVELHFVQDFIGDSNEQYWVGLDYNSTIAKFTWVTSKHEPARPMWLPDEPNDTGKCVRLATEAQTGTNVKGRTHLLGDHGCNNNYQVLCEKSADLQEPLSYTDMLVWPSNRCPMSAYTTRSILECAVNCSSGGSCTGFQFDIGPKRCTPYKFSTTCPTPLTAPVSMYVMSSARC